MEPSMRQEGFPEKGFAIVIAMLFASIIQTVVLHQVDLFTEPQNMLRQYGCTVLPALFRNRYAGTLGHHHQHIPEGIISSQWTPVYVWRHSQSDVGGRNTVTRLLHVWPHTTVWTIPSSCLALCSPHDG